MTSLQLITIRKWSSLMIVRTACLPAGSSNQLQLNEPTVIFAYKSISTSHSLRTKLESHTSAMTSIETPILATNFHTSTQKSKDQVETIADEPEIVGFVDDFAFDLDLHSEKPQLPVRLFSRSFSCL